MKKFNVIATENYNYNIASDDFQAYHAHFAKREDAESELILIDDDRVKSITEENYEKIKAYYEKFLAEDVNDEFFEDISFRAYFT